LDFDSIADLTTWQHMPVALFPNKLGDIFSGSARDVDFFDKGV
jgi:sucrose-6-phosphate hydrolase SacC (GH32 family)